MTTATITPTLFATSTRSTVSTTPVWRVGALAAAAASVAATAVALVAKAAGVPLKAAPKTADAGRSIPLNGYAVGVLSCTAIGIVIALALLRWSKRRAATFVVVTTVLTILSFSGPITTGHATTATRLVLSLTHVVAAAIVIPALTVRLARRTVG